MLLRRRWKPTNKFVLPTRDLPGCASTTEGGSAGRKAGGDMGAKGLSGKPLVHEPYTYSGVVPTWVPSSAFHVKRHVLQPRKAEISQESEIFAAHPATSGLYLAVARLRTDTAAAVAKPQKTNRIA